MYNLTQKFEIQKKYFAKTRLLHCLTPCALRYHESVALPDTMCTVWRPEEESCWWKFIRKYLSVVYIRVEESEPFTLRFTSLNMWLYWWCSNLHLYFVVVGGGWVGWLWLVVVFLLPHLHTDAGTASFSTSHGRYLPNAFQFATDQLPHNSTL